LHRGGGEWRSGLTRAGGVFNGAGSEGCADELFEEGACVFLGFEIVVEFSVKPKSPETL
jgi:hypothetical protein